jgi:hypothetical protein
VCAFPSTQDGSRTTDFIIYPFVFFGKISRQGGRRKGYSGKNGSPNHGPATPYQEMEEATLQPLPQMPEADSRPPSSLQDLPPLVEDRLTGAAARIAAAGRIAEPVPCVAAAPTA